jgi:predicted transcriptional regulator
VNSKNVPAEKSEQYLKDISESLAEIRRLMIYGLVRSGASQGDVAAALGVTQQTVSNLMAKKKKRK